MDKLPPDHLFPEASLDEPTDNSRGLRPDKTSAFHQRTSSKLPTPAVCAEKTDTRLTAEKKLKRKKNQTTSNELVSKSGVTPSNDCSLLGPDKTETGETNHDNKAVDDKLVDKNSWIANNPLPIQYPKNKLGHAEVPEHITKTMLPPIPKPRHQAPTCLIPPTNHDYIDPLYSELISILEGNGDLFGNGTTGPPVKLPALERNGDLLGDGTTRPPVKLPTLEENGDPFENGTTGPPVKLPTLEGNGDLFGYGTTGPPVKLPAHERNGDLFGYGTTGPPVRLPTFKRPKNLNDNTFFTSEMEACANNAMEKKTSPHPTKEECKARGYKDNRADVDRICETNDQNVNKNEATNNLQWTLRPQDHNLLCQGILAWRSEGRVRRSLQCSTESRLSVNSMLLPPSILSDFRNLAQKYNGDLDKVQQQYEQSGRPMYLLCQQCFQLYGENRVTYQGSCARCGQQMKYIPSILKEIKALQRTIKDKDFEVHDVTPDGNCMFSAVVDQLTIQGNFLYTTEGLREAVVTYLKKCPLSSDGTPYEDFLLGYDSWDAYLMRMAQDGEWGDHLTLVAISELLQMDIVVYGGSSGKAMTSIRSKRSGQSSTSKHIRPIILGHLAETHYISLRPSTWREANGAESYPDDTGYNTTTTEMKQVLEKNNLEVHDVTPDGNCMFSAVVDQLNIQGNFLYTTEGLRKAVVTFLEKNPLSSDGTPYKDFLLEHASWDAYLIRMAQDGEWGDHLTLVALADMLQMDIVIYGLSEGSKTVSIHPKGKDSNSKKTEPITLGHFLEYHYTSLRRNAQRDGARDRADFDVIASRQGSSHMPYFPVEYLDLVIQQMYDHGIQAFNDPKLGCLPLYQTFIACGEIKVQLVGSVISKMKLIISPYNDLSDEGLAILFQKRPHVKTSFPFLSYFCIFFNTAITEIFTEANNMDLVIDGDLETGSFKLIPKKPKLWKGETVNTNGKEHLRHMHVIRNKRICADVRANMLPELHGKEQLVLAFEMYWPSCAFEWNSRKRPSGFPSPPTVSSIISRGCHVIPLTAVTNIEEVVCGYFYGDKDNDHTDWTVSFASAESELCNYLTSEQRMCFLMLRCLLDETIIGHRIPYSVLLHTFFYACEHIMECEWKTKPSQCALVLLQHLHEAYYQKYCPHYFIASANLLQILSQQDSLCLAAKLKSVLSNPLLALHRAFNIYSSRLNFILPLVIDICFEISKAVCNEMPRSRLRACFCDRARVVLYRHVRDMVAEQKIPKAAKTLLIFSVSGCFCYRDITQENIDSVIVSALEPLDDWARWGISLYLDLSLQEDLTRQVFNNQPTIPIADVFGPSSTLDISDTVIPEQAAIAFGELMYPTTLHTVLVAFGKSRELIDAIKFYLREYIAKLEGDTIYLPLTIVPCSKPDTNATMSNIRAQPTLILNSLYNMHVSLYNECFYSFVVQEYREYLPHLEKVVRALNSKFCFDYLKKIRKSLNFQPIGRK